MRMRVYIRVVVDEVEPVFWRLGGGAVAALLLPYPLLSLFH
jgi:hypothetical protein